MHLLYFDQVVIYWIKYNEVLRLVCFIPEEHATARSKFVYRALYNKSLSQLKIFELQLMMIIDIRKEYVSTIVLLHDLGRWDGGPSLPLQV